MLSFGRITILATFLVAALGIGACGSDDPAAPADNTDKTAPQIVSTDPGGGEAAVLVGESISVVFSEAMDPVTATGQVTVAPGSNVDFVWTDNRTLYIDHDDWAEGTEITVTLGTGLTDAAGNALAAAFSFSFWTVTTTELLLLETTPTDGALNVNRDDPILLQFSAGVNDGTVAGNITIDDGAKALYGFTHDELEEGLLLLDPIDTLPASTTFTVTIGTGLQGQGAISLASPESFTFTTGVAVDNTPPTVLSVEPSNGTTTIPVDQGFFRMTFSEAVNPDTLEPRRSNLAFYFMLQAMESEPIWSEGGTVLTVPLPSPLPAGMPIDVTFADFADLAGNVQTAEFVYDVKIAGTADYVPVIDGTRFVAEVEWERGEIGNPTPSDDGYYEYLMQLEVQPDQSFRLVEYDNTNFTDPGAWEAYRKTASQLQWLGFEDSGGSAPAKEMFDGPLNILPLPIATGTWTDQTTVTIVGEGLFRASVSGRVVSQSDYVIVESGGSVFIKDAWKVARSLEVEVQDGEIWLPAFTQDDTIWFAPNMGDVRTETYEEDELEGTWEQSVTWHFPYSDRMIGKSGSSFWSR